jgi:hypothetical protein
MVRSTASFAMNIFVQESHDAIAVRLEESRSSLVVIHALVVRRAVEFDDQLRLVAEEVRDVRTDGNLTAEFEAIEFAVTEVVPELLLGGNVLTAQVSGAC